MPRRYRYTIKIIPEEDGIGYYAVVPSLPGCFSQGKTIEDAKKNIKEAITHHTNCLNRGVHPI